MKQLNRYTVIVTMLLALSLILVVPQIASAASPNTGPQTWSLDSKKDKDGKKLPPNVNQMEKNYGPGDDGQSGSVSIPGGSSFIWVSDQPTEADFTVPGGAWILQIVTDSDWGSQGSKCRIEIGEWDGSFISLTGTSQTLKNRTISKAIYATLFQTKSITISKGKNLAFKITNLENPGKNHIIFTGEGNDCSYIRSSQAFSYLNPTPELPAGLLLALGLTGLGAFIVARRRSVKKSYSAR